MASTTGFYGLQKLGAGDTLNYNDYAFTNQNIDIIDRVLHKLDEAVFGGVAGIADPDEGPSLELSTSGGVIPGGRTLRYKFTYVDANGNETAASPETSITTTAPVTRPSQPSLTTDATGSLLAGNYFYIVSAYVDVNTAETNGSPAATINIPSGTNNSVTLTLPSLPSGATGFNIFRRGPGETQFYYLDSVDMDVATPPTTYFDDNSVTVNNSRTPSATNLTYATNSIAITLPGATPAVPDGYTWKLYRTFVSGNYDSSLLEWVVTETSEGSGIINPVAYDYGGRTTIGKPPTVSSITGTTSRIDTLETDVADIQTTLGTNPEGGFASVAARLDAMYSSWTELWFEDMSGATPPTVAEVFDDVVQSGSSTASETFTQEVEFVIVGTDPAYVVKNQTVVSGTVAYQFKALIPAHTDSTVLFRADNGIAAPGTEDYIHVLVAPGRTSELLRFGVDWGYDGSSYDGAYLMSMYDHNFYVDSYYDIRLEVDWVPIVIDGTSYSKQLRLFVNGNLVHTVNNLGKSDTNGFDRAIFGSYGASTVNVAGTFSFDNFLIETKEYDQDRLLREEISLNTLYEIIDPLTQYPLRSATYQNSDTVVVGNVYLDDAHTMTVTAHPYRYYKIIGQILFNAPSAEDLKFKITSATIEATPQTASNLQFTVEPGTLVAPSSVGGVYGEGDDVVLAGTGGLLAVTILGAFSTTEIDTEITLSICQDTTPATPTGTTIALGTWFSIESLLSD